MKPNTATACTARAPKWRPSVITVVLCSPFMAADSRSG
jgi:hypothetical protein